MRFFPEAQTKATQLSEQIRLLRREIADIDTKQSGLKTARQARMNSLARLESQLALCGEIGPARALMACS